MSGMRSEQGLFDAAIESANVFNWVASECAATSGLLLPLEQRATAAELMMQFHVHPEKASSFQALLNVLVDTGLIAQQEQQGQVIYHAQTDVIAENRALDGGLRRYTPRQEVLVPWFGEQHTDLIRSANRQLLGDDLSFFRSPSVKVRFDRSFLREWRINLENPLYEFGRVLAVRELVQRGQRFLDLASGLGYGAQRIAEFAAPRCEIVCVDKSVDFLAEAQLLIYPGAKVRFIKRDLNRGLPPLPAKWFDGILFNGAFHFIEDKLARLREMHQVLRPGGLLVIGHCYSHSGFADDAMHELYFSLVENKTWVISFDKLRSLVSEAGFQEVRQYHRGSHSYLLAERMSDPLSPDIREM